MQTVTSPILAFRGEWRFLSNFWPSTLTIEGIRYHSVEHAYQAMKTLDLEARQRISLLAYAKDAKRVGRTVILRPGWKDMRVAVMNNLVRQKFNQDVWLRQMLLSTGDAELVEGNNWGDRFWGVSRGVGENVLGKILMKVRSELR